MSSFQQKNPLETGRTGRLGRWTGALVLLVFAAAACRPSVPDGRPQLLPVPAAMDQAETSVFQVTALREGLEIPGTVQQTVARVLLDSETFGPPSPGRPSLGAVRVGSVRTLPHPRGAQVTATECLASENGTPLVLTRTESGPDGTWFHEIRNEGGRVRTRGSRGEWNGEKKIEGVWYFPEQMPFLARALADRKVLHLRMLRARTNGGWGLSGEDLEAGGFEVMASQGQSNRVLRGVLRPTRSGAGEGETWWVDPVGGRIVQYEREIGAGPWGAGVRETARLRWTAWLGRNDALPPASAPSDEERRQATLRSLLAMNAMKIQMERTGRSFSLSEWLTAGIRPREWVTSPLGSDRVVTNRDDAGGFFFDDKTAQDGRPGRFYFNGPAAKFDPSREP